MNVDWKSVFSMDTPPLELLVRGTVMYLALFTALRLLVRREAGSMGLTDLLLLVLIADAAQNAMAGDYHSVPSGIVLCGTLIGWNYVLDWLAFRFKPVRRLLEGSPLPLVRDGEMLLRNMRRELITRDELSSHLRENGIDNLEDVKLASLEPDGQLSVIKREGSGGDSEPSRKRRGPP